LPSPLFIIIVVFLGYCLSPLSESATFLVPNRRIGPTTGPSRHSRLCLAGAHLPQICPRRLPKTADLPQRALPSPANLHLCLFDTCSRRRGSNRRFCVRRSIKSVTSLKPSITEYWSFGFFPGTGAKASEMICSAWMITRGNLCELVEGPFILQFNMPITTPRCPFARAIFGDAGYEFMLAVCCLFSNGWGNLNSGPILGRGASASGRRRSVPAFKLIQRMVQVDTVQRCYVQVDVSTDSDVLYSASVAM
jgi:hypothetical protein